jgi:hypothetical protein
MTFPRLGIENGRLAETDIGDAADMHSTAWGTRQAAPTYQPIRLPQISWKLPFIQIVDFDWNWAESDPAVFYGQVL